MEYISLLGSDKEADTGENDQKMVIEMNKAVEEKIRPYLGEYKTIVIVGHRSHAHGFDILCEDGRDR